LSSADTAHDYWLKNAFCCVLLLQSKVVANLDFAPTSMTYRRGFLAAGGAHGEVREGVRGEGA
jgi:hypothetical protein